ncbi:MAG: HAD family phosphatase [Erysipelotrichaceae bacterium]|nr:HAD family phosphatase [Erysipelotrichaceae bacterium]
MIKNIIFDLGNVLLRFSAEEFLDYVDVHGRDRKILMNEVFRSPEWAMMDRGSIDEDEAYEAMIRFIPEHLHKKAESLVKSWYKMTGNVEGMTEVVKTLKENGYGIYLLSNANFAIHKYWDSLPYARYFDGMIASCDYLLVKPQNEIYHLFESVYDLKLDECLFIDDSCANVEGAIHNGMEGIVFHNDVEDLIKKLRYKGINI